MSFEGSMAQAEIDQNLKTKSLSITKFSSKKNRKGWRWSLLAETSKSALNSPGRWFKVMDH